MYVREKKVRRGERVYSYYQLVEGRRFGGVVRQRVVAHLGPLASREQADALARNTGALCAVLTCGHAPTVERGVVAMAGERDRIKVCAVHADALDRGDTVRAYG